MTVMGHLHGDLFKIRVKRCTNFAHGVVAIAHADVADVELQRNHLRLDWAEKALADRLRHGILVGF